VSLEPIGKRFWVIKITNGLWVGYDRDHTRFVKVGTIPEAIRFESFDRADDYRKTLHLMGYVHGVTVSFIEDDTREPTTN